MRVLVAFFTLFLGGMPPAPVFADSPPSPKVAQVSGVIRGRDAHIQFRLENAFSPEMVESLKSGIEISFRVSVEVERVHRNWFDVTVGALQYTHSIRYDVLSRVYRLQHPGGIEILPDIRQALERMTRFQVTVPLFGEVTRGKPYQAAVRVRLDRAGLSEPLRSIVFFSSMWDVETDWGRGPVKAP